MYYTFSLSVVTLRQFLKELCLEYRKCAVSSNVGNVQFRALFSYMLWHIELKFVLMCVLKIKFECCHFESILKELCLFLNLDYRKMHISYSLSPTFFDILNWNFEYDFVLMHFRSNRVLSLCVNFWRSYTSLWTKNIGNVQFSTLSWAEILHMTLF